MDDHQIVELPVLPREHRGFVAETLCRECGGQCCKTSPGFCHPREWTKEGSDELAMDRIVTALGAGDFSLTIIPGDPRPNLSIPVPEVDQVQWSVVLRPGYQGASGKIFDVGVNRPCVHLGPDGCRFTPEKRPLGCLALKPNPLAPGKGCKESTYAGLDAQLAWLPYRDDLVRAAAELGQQPRDAEFDVEALIDSATILAQAHLLEAPRSLAIGCRNVPVFRQIVQKAVLSVILGDDY